ncbi:helix-turn-helix domain-containing protein [Cohnella soli]|uniref:LuxR C-terminal-related transcriptional regulator n=1 Tax=Cohnella soli TaxID=425005 RepID=A0ABW0I1V1_9BACL
MKEEIDQEHIGNTIDTEERRYLVGREKEVAFLRECLTSSLRDGSIIHLYGMEYWLREEFLPQLSKNTLIVISGRYPLQGGWSFSPAWRELIWRLPIDDLDFSSVKAYLARAGIAHEETVRHIWNQTKGHPLTLSLLVSTTLAQHFRQVVASEARDVFSQVVGAWLREVPDAHLRELVETAAVLRHFNEELLAYVMDKPVATEQFLKLVSLSFIRRVDRGWLLHDLMRDAICFELRRRRPDHYESLRKRCIMHYYYRIKASARSKTTAWESEEWIYYVGDQWIRGFFYQQAASCSWEPLHAGNWTEAEAYVERRRRNAKDTRFSYRNPETREVYEYFISAEESLYTLKHIRLHELYELDSGIVKLIRDTRGAVCGLSAIVPINVDTVDYLCIHPLSSSYFSKLTEAQLKEYKLSPNTKAGYFVMTIDVGDFSDLVMREATGITFINHMLSPGICIAAPPAHPMFEDIHLRLGCEKLAGSEHCAYDGITPTPLYAIDTRGNKLQQFLNKMIALAGLPHMQDPEDEGLASLSEREKDVVELLVKGYTNLEIAGSLYLSEITVKKHLGNIFRKLDVKNRAQLVNRYMRSSK